MAEYYFCKKCKKTLHEEDFVEVYDNETGMYIYICPFCGNRDHYDAFERCEACGGIFSIKEMSGKLCESCLTEAANDKKARADYFESLDDSVQCDIIFADAEDFANFITDRSGRRYI